MFSNRSIWKIFAICRNIKRHVRNKTSRSFERFKMLLSISANRQSMIWFCQLATIFIAMKYGHWRYYYNIRTCKSDNEPNQTEIKDINLKKKISAFAWTRISNCNLFKNNRLCHFANGFHLVKNKTCKLISGTKFNFKSMVLYIKARQFPMSKHILRCGLNDKVVQLLLKEKKKISPAWPFDRVYDCWFSVCNFNEIYRWKWCGTIDKCMQTRIIWFSTKK